MSISNVNNVLATYQYEASGGTNSTKKATTNLTERVREHRRF